MPSSRPAASTRRASARTRSRLPRSASSIATWPAPIRGTFALGLAAAALAVAPAGAFADHGDDDGARGGDDHGGQRDDRGGGDDNGGRRADDDKKNERRVAGSCTGSTSAKLKAKHDDGRLEVEFEVDQNRNGVTWKVQLRRNDSVVVKTRATTTAPSGSFSVERKIADPAGNDRIKAKATSPSGEVCTASVTI
jgi:hypothetical protein